MSRTGDRRSRAGSRAGPRPAAGRGESKSQVPRSKSRIVRGSSVYYIMTFTSRYRTFTSGRLFRADPSLLLRESEFDFYKSGCSSCNIAGRNAKRIV
jgi:hypothetical protein